MSKENLKAKKISSEVAFQELKDFLKPHLKKEFRRGKMTKEKIEEDYVDVLEAIEDGYLIFDGKKPIYTLREPLFSNAENKENIVKTVNFRQRIKEADRALVMDGLDLEKQRGTYILKLLSYITQLSMTEIKELEKEDFNVLNQICSVF